MQPSESKLAVSEIFGPTLQGEGPSVGKPAIFIRLAGCNLSCSWCDTPYTWDWSRYDRKVEVSIMTIREVRNSVMNLCFESDTVPPILVITGGEPMLQQQGILSLYGMVQEMFQHIEIETNGTRPPLPDMQSLGGIKFNISPKLPHSGQTEGLHPDWRAMPWVPKVYKFVCGSVEDLDLVQKMNLPPKDIWIMPQGINREEILAPWVTQLAEATILRGWNFTTRLHTLLWGQERAR